MPHLDLEEVKSSSGSSMLLKEQNKKNLADNDSITTASASYITKMRDFCASGTIHNLVSCNLRKLEFSVI